MQLLVIGSLGSVKVRDRRFRTQRAGRRYGELAHNRGGVGGRASRLLHWRRPSGLL